MKHLLKFSLVISMGCCAFVAHAEEIDDVETGMESALAESDAAQTEATAAKDRAKEERAKLEKAKSEAQDATARAKEKEASATQEIQRLEAKIVATVAERKKHEKIKAQAEKQIVALDAAVMAKKNKLAAAEAKRDAARSEKEAQEAIVNKLALEQKELEEKIIKTKNETAALTTEITRLQEDALVRQKALVQLRTNAQKAANVRDKRLKEKQSIKRNVSSVPSRVIMRSVKHECDVTDAAADGAAVLGKVKPGPRQELYKVVDKRWVEIKFGESRGYVAKSCFK